MNECRRQEHLPWKHCQVPGRHESCLARVRTGFGVRIESSHERHGLSEKQLPGPDAAPPKIMGMASPALGFPPSLSVVYRINMCSSEQS